MSGLGTLRPVPGVCPLSKEISVGLQKALEHTGVRLLLNIVELDREKFSRRNLIMSAVVCVVVAAQYSCLVWGSEFGLLCCRFAEKHEQPVASRSPGRVHR